MPEYRLAPLFSKQACACQGVCALFYESQMIHTARQLMLDDPQVSGFGDYAPAWRYARLFKTLDAIGDADRKARQRYLEHVQAQVDGREQPATRRRHALADAA